MDVDSRKVEIVVNRRLLGHRTLRRPHRYQFRFRESNGKSSPFEVRFWNASVLHGDTVSRRKENPSGTVEMGKTMGVIVVIPARACGHFSSDKLLEMQ